MRFLPTPSEKRSGKRTCKPGTPFAISLNVVCSPLGSFPDSSKRYGAWSEESTWKVPSLRPCQTASCDASSRGGGLQHHFAPSRPGLSASELLRKRLCVQVLAHMRAHRVWAA